MQRPIARSSVLALALSLIPWPGLVLGPLVAGLVPHDVRAIAVTVCVLAWLGSTLLASFTLVTSGFALSLAQGRRAERRGRLVATTALVSSIGATVVGWTPPVVAVLGVVLALCLGALALAMIPAMGPMGRPLGPVAAGGHLLFASRRRIWAARAEDEARSVQAFEALVPILEAHGAPAALLDRTRHAAADEARHAVLAAALAGVPAPTPEPEPDATPVDPGSVEARLTLAQESFADGCIGEAFAAAILLEESRRTGTPEPAIIAADEAEHAALAWDLLDWALSDPEVAARFTGPSAPHAMVTPSRAVPLWTQQRVYRRIRGEAFTRLRNQ